MTAVRKPLPDHIKKYAFDFHWSNTLLWQLDVPVETMDIAELVWHFDVPWLHTEGERFNLTPNEILQSPKLYKEQYQRTMEADLSYPIDIMHNKGRWLILDGLHRLMKAANKGYTTVRVRKISRSLVPKIEIT